MINLKNFKIEAEIYKPPKRPKTNYGRTLGHWYTGPNGVPVNKNKK